MLQNQKKDRIVMMQIAVVATMDKKKLHMIKMKVNYILEARKKENLTKVKRPSRMWQLKKKRLKIQKIKKVEMMTKKPKKKKLQLRKNENIFGNQKNIFKKF